MTGDTRFLPRLADGLDTAAIRGVFESMGRVHVPAVLEAASARRAHEILARQTPWQLSLNPAGRHLDLGVEGIEGIPEPQRAAVIEGLHGEAAGTGFRYVFNNFPIFDLFAADDFADHPLMDLLRFLNGERFLEFARAATGMPEITFADAQATRYCSGHFLTEHDDDVAGKKRLAAYVLNFTPDWRADWGGVLQFVDGDGHVAEGYVPKFNALNLLRVPQKHAVTYVTPVARGARLSVTGWLRAGEPPECLKPLLP